jgi:hypothetical protein
VRGRALVVVAAVTAGSLAFARGGRAVPEPRAPGPSTPAYVRGTREADNAGCIRCHSGVASAHGGSLHATSWTDASFQRGYAIEPAAFCRACHAPESAPQAEPDAWARAVGVACVTCHAPEGTRGVLASTRAPRAPREGRSVSAPAPHEIVRLDDFGTRACVACHDFSFPGAAALGARGRMQKTALEHVESSDRGRACASCHMPPGGPRGQSMHAFPASRDASMLSAALEVVASRDAATGHLVWTLASKGVGHAFPTGDLFRRLVLRVETVRGTIERPFERAFRSSRDATGAVVRFESGDTRVRPDHAQRVELALPGGPGEVSWMVVYQRVTAVEQSPPFAATIEQELVLAHGRL